MNTRALWLFVIGGMVLWQLITLDLGGAFAVLFLGWLLVPLL